MAFDIDTIAAIITRQSADNNSHVVNDIIRVMRFMLQSESAFSKSDLAFKAAVDLITEAILYQHPQFSYIVPPRGGDMEDWVLGLEYQFGDQLTLSPVPPDKLTFSEISRRMRTIHASKTAV